MFYACVIIVFYHKCCLSSTTKLTCDTKWATLAVTIIALGRMLTTILVFKGMLGGHIATRDLATYPCGCIYGCQSAAWRYEVVMLQWAEQLLKPYVLEASSHVVPLLLLDSIRCRMMALVVWKSISWELKTAYPRWMHNLCQPVDVGVAKPLTNDPRINW